MPVHMSVPVPASERASASAPAPATSQAADPLRGVRPTSTTNEPPQPSALDVEIALLRDAHSALHAGNATRALSLLDQHDQLYPAGVLEEDAAAVRIYALCAVGQAAQARALADRFLASHPSSPHAASVRASCGAH
jgi:hypothetical protein